MIVDSIIARDLHTEIRFKIDRNTEYRNFSLVRWRQVILHWPFSLPKPFEFEDPHARSLSTVRCVTARSKPFFFKVTEGWLLLERGVKLSKLNHCQGVHQRDDEFNYLGPYTKNMDPSVILYRVTYADVQYPPELIFPLTMNFRLLTTCRVWRAGSPQICYYVQANEYVNDRPLVTSLSRMVCTEVIPDVVMPNAIDPLSDYSSAGHFTRNNFAPIITFKANYRLTIYNRWGGIVFNGTNEGWDGKLANGEYAKEGAYIYRLEVFSETKRTITKTGSLTVIYGPKR